MELNWREISDIIYEVIDLTQEKLIRWQAYDDDGITTYTIELGLGCITISRQYESMDDEYDYSLRINNSAGEEIYACLTEFENRTNQKQLHKLYDVAEDSFLQRQATIDSIKEAISKIKSENIF